MATVTATITRAEFWRTIALHGLRAALFLARELGVCLAQAQLWVRGYLAQWKARPAM